MKNDGAFRVPQTAEEPGITMRLYFGACKWGNLVKWQIYNNITTTQISNVFKFWQIFFDMSVHFINQLRIRTKFVTFFRSEIHGQKDDKFRLVQTCTNGSCPAIHCLDCRRTVECFCLVTAVRSKVCAKPVSPADTIGKQLDWLATGHVICNV